MMKKKAASIILLSILSLIMFYIFNRAANVVELVDGDVISKLSAISSELIPSIKENPVFINTEKGCLITGGIGFVFVWLIYLYHYAGPKNYMHGKEHGSARWGTHKDIKNFMDKNYQQNILFTEKERLSMSDRMKLTKDDDYNRNKHVLVIGGSGSGKTRFYVKPNIMQMHSSYVIVDPKGSLLHETGKMLQDNGYKLKVFDLINREKSDKYNPFEYLKTEDDILKLINNLIANTNTGQNKGAGDFWEKSEIALLQAIFGYILFECPKSDQSINTAMELLLLAEVKEENEDFESPLDCMFKILGARDPEHFAVRQYKIFKQGAGKTTKSILISVGVRLSAFNIKSISNIVSADTIGLDMIGSEKTALFIILPDTDKSFNFLAAMMFQQMFDILVYRADNEYNGKLPFHVRCIMDEFANVGQIPMLETLIATIRSRGISLSIILQNLAQIKNLYKDTWEVITGNCDSLFFLGGMEQSTLKYISEMCGKMTIDNQNINETKGQSYSVNNQILGRDLITPAEAGGLSGRECILKIRGCPPFKSRKFDISKHKNYKYLADGGASNEKNWFSIEDRPGAKTPEQTQKEFFKEETVQVTKIDVSELNALT